MKKIILILSSILLLLVSSCQQKTQKSNLESNKSYLPKYAHFFKIEYFNSYKKISILNPWENEDLNINYYILNGKNEDIKADDQNFILQQAASKTIALSSPMVGLIHILGLDSTLVGVSDPALIYNQKIIENVEEGKIANVGKDISVNMETVLSLQADLIVGSGWDKLSPDVERMIKLKQTPLLMYDWQETHPLGKAEWIVLLASFFNRENEAIELFNGVVKRYEALKESAHYDKQPDIFNGSEYQGIWYSAGGKSYVSQLYKDAGGKYIMRNDSSKGSVMLDFEVIMAKAEKADIWMYTGSTDAASLSLLNNPKYQAMDAVKKHRVFSYHKSLNSRGANEYWENASYQPDVVLQDLIKIFHDSDPQDLYYFKRLEY